MDGALVHPQVYLPTHRLKTAVTHAQHEPATSTPTRTHTHTHAHTQSQHQRPPPANTHLVLDSGELTLVAQPVGHGAPIYGTERHRKHKERQWTLRKSFSRTA